MAAARVARPALALVATLLLAGGIAGCGSSHNPAYQQGYDAGAVARNHFIEQQGPASNLPWLCAVAAYKDVQNIPNSTAALWENGFNMGCAQEST
jgi:hypothetical protein